MKTYRAMAIANFFVDKANANNEEMTHLKLQKLVYFAKGFSLARPNPKRVLDSFFCRNSVEYIACLVKIH